MRKTLMTASLIAAIAGAAALPNAASAYPYRHHHYRYYNDHRYHRSCGAERHRTGATGAIAGAIGGALIGGAISHGRAPQTLLGAGAGALTGNALARGSVHC